MTSILKVDEIQNTDGKTGIVITPDGSLESVKFPEQSNPSGRVITSTTMSSYEEGTWTPTNTGCTFNLYDSVYTRIGRLVNCSAYVEITSTGSVQIWGGLPFTPAYSGSSANGGFVFYQNVETTETWTVLLSGDTGFTFRQGVNAQSNFASTKNIRFNIIYYTNE